ncbi:NAD-dependent epimerase/dehydratase family protein [Microbacterium sp. zg.Y1090]|uniref:NAD-dependent epimerase/dehydratase family protein n=1 Tax=Microbacterium wangruii TaxID=3049073 RepID=UPI00214C8F43|nr:MULTISPECIES: NAD-dependent epimerase/dehydratase family protein [unclassified Microbacterium]MCR2818310.1 NAD-dependent epimerase/dehydratase family protein [Microbacterium sp. zg.Y1090]WIM27548.1 NAD-dependent epimerase/dehydratase family protein [Microbacterium sp. zg-Y1090]
MVDVLMLGGTGWLGSRVAERWLAKGAKVTCLARGRRPAPEGARLVTADRGAPGAYDAVADREWDEVVDVSSDAAHVASAVTALAAHTRHFTFVSTVSVYADADGDGDESDAVVGPAAAGQSDYPHEKAAAEAIVRSALAHRAAIVRPGLIAGPGDPTDRFGYWVSRFALAGDAPVLVPETDGKGAAVIDVDDLADFIVAIGDARWTGVVNAVGDPHALADVLAQAREVAGHTGDIVAASDSWLAEHAVGHWSGPRSLPLTVPSGHRGVWSRSNAAYKILGGRLRPLRSTLERTLDAERTAGLDRDRRAGMTREEEISLLSAIE